MNQSAPLITPEELVAQVATELRFHATRQHGGSKALVSQFQYNPATGELRVLSRVRLESVGLKTPDEGFFNCGYVYWRYDAGGLMQQAIDHGKGLLRAIKQEVGGG